jgi:hypothetical protein|tara:strand:- start:71 stop:379 length:309 start_codon:yes stop_codon:yes gene_type:complete
MDGQTDSAKTDRAKSDQHGVRAAAAAKPSDAQRKWLARGLDQPGGKLPLFDESGQKVSPRTVKSCVNQGWAEPWFDNPIKPDWQVCKLTDEGRKLISDGGRN